LPQLEPLTDQQHAEICTLRQSSQQAEDALSQGVDKLQQTLAQSIAADLSCVDTGSYRTQMAATIENLEALEGFVNQVFMIHVYALTLSSAARFTLLFFFFFSLYFLSSKEEEFLQIRSSFCCS